MLVLWDLPGCLSGRSNCWYLKPVLPVWEKGKPNRPLNERKKNTEPGWIWIVKSLSRKRKADLTSASKVPGAKEPGWTQVGESEAHKPHGKERLPRASLGEESCP